MQRASNRSLQPHRGGEKKRSWTRGPRFSPSEHRRNLRIGAWDRFRDRARSRRTLTRPAGLPDEAVAPSSRSLGLRCSLPVGCESWKVFHAPPSPRRTSSCAKASLLALGSSCESPPLVLSRNTFLRDSSHEVLRLHSTSGAIDPKWTREPDLTRAPSSPPLHLLGLITHLAV